MLAQFLFDTCIQMCFTGVLSVASNFSPCDSLSYRGCAVTDRRLDFVGICLEGKTFTQPLENTKGVVSI